MNRNIPFRPTHVLRFGNWACLVHVKRDRGDRRSRPLNGPCYQRHEWDDGKVAEWQLEDGLLKRNGEIQWAKLTKIVTRKGR